MKHGFLNISIKEVKFTGLSPSYLRVVALLASFTIWVAMTYFGFHAALMSENIPSIDAIALLILSVLLVHFIYYKEFVMLTWANYLVKHTPVVVLYLRDRKIINLALIECLSISGKVQFEDYLEYSKVNPAIRSRGNLMVIAHQRKGDLHLWVKNPRNLKKLANLIFQMYLAERFLSDDGDNVDVVE